MSDNTISKILADGKEYILHAAKATSDENGNNIAETYATKEQSSQIQIVVWEAND